MALYFTVLLHTDIKCIGVTISCFCCVRAEQKWNFPWLEKSATWNIMLGDLWFAQNVPSGGSRPKRFTMLSYCVCELPACRAGVPAVWCWGSCGLVGTFPALLRDAPDGGSQTLWPWCSFYNWKGGDGRAHTHERWVHNHGAVQFHSWWIDELQV